MTFTKGCIQLVSIKPIKLLAI